MPGIDHESHFKFLLSCIRHSAAGKVNFAAVAEELDIVSKAAAAKRYERLLKAHDAQPAPGTPKKGDGAPATPKTPASRKRKAPKVEKDDDDESVKGESGNEKKPAMKREKRVKAEKADSATDGSFIPMRRNVKMCDIPWATEEVLAAAREGKAEVVTVVDDDNDDGGSAEVEFLSESNTGGGSAGAGAEVEDEIAVV
ncbi:hypothetical protein B0T16DRAFT_386801 [Cercophora newfieldiana]|uniref:Myb-like DNA-binding domain-containing protein n=1 Tax=Cercophora newfieldiana TaxID=92897 RepID=A0AA39YFD8_9PEZI|nr:hypothetical protein B0T16DRAFT_386801 [Cercophora newfieldiana]